MRTVFTKTSGERNAEIVIGIVRPIRIHIDTIRIEIADIDKLAIRVATFLALFHLWQQQYGALARHCLYKYAAAFGKFPKSALKKCKAVLT